MIKSIEFPVELKILNEKCAENISLTQLPENLAKKLKSSDSSVLPLILTTHQIINTTCLPWEEIGNDVGIIAVGSIYPKVTTGALIAELNDNGRVSPLNFINANAGAGISICCTLYKFQGPTINLTMPKSSHRNDIVNSVACQWLINGHAKYIFCVISEYNEKNEIVVNNKLISL